MPASKSWRKRPDERRGGQVSLGEIAVLVYVTTAFVIFAAILGWVSRR